MNIRWKIWVLGLTLFAACGKTDHSGQLPKGYSERIIFPLQHEHVHGPAIVELPNGDLLSAWFQGSGERWADDVRIMGARMSPGDTAWSAPFLLADTPGFPDVNPMMFLDSDRRLWLMWYPVLANQWETSIPKYRISVDYENPGAPVWSWQDIVIVKPGDRTERGIQPGDRFVESVKKQLADYEDYLHKTLISEIPEENRAYLLKRWEAYKYGLDSLARGKNMVRRGRLKTAGGEKPVRLGYPLSRRIGWQTKNKPLIVSGRIIVPLYSDGLNCSLFALTDDLGKTWQFSNPVIGGIGIQPTLAVSKDGTLSAYLRDNGPPPQRMQLTKSFDGGLSWTIAKDDLLPNPGAGFDMTNLASGEWLIVYNHAEEGRHDLTVALSDDDGESWKWKKQLEFDDRGHKATASHYPAIIQGANGMIHVVYSFHHRDREGGPHKTIKYASFPASWVKD
ncbi:MAG: exo-alpha-sialidase [Cytophagales bacterium]|nr:exo-alpha-sialidase [Cytophagales bacterium]